MNEAAKMVSELLAGNYHTNILIGDKAYFVSPPVIKVLCRATTYFSKVDISAEMNIVDIMAVVVEQRQNIIKGLSYLIAGDVEDYEDKAASVANDMQLATDEELSAAVAFALDLLTGRDFFVAASSTMELAKMIAKPKQ